MFRNGELVDRMLTVSALSRFNFNFANSLLRIARRQINLELKDIPRPNQYARAHDLVAEWKRTSYAGPLWWTILRVHAVPVAWQNFLVMSAVLNIAPQWVLLQLLRLLEEQETFGHFGPEVWIWVVWLAIALLAQSVREINSAAF